MGLVGRPDGLHVHRRLAAVAASLSRDPCSNKLVFFPRISHLTMADYDGLGDAARRVHGAGASVPGAEHTDTPFAQNSTV